MPHKKKTVTLILIFISTLLPILITAVGCYTEPEEQSQFTGTPEEVTFCHSARLDTLLLIAYELGYLRNNGINATLKKFTTGGHSIARMIDGECDVAFSGGNPVVYQSFKHDDIRIFAIVGESDNSSRIIARRDRGIKSPEDLAGKKIAAQKGTVFHFFTSLLLAKHGLTTNDVELSFVRAEELEHEDAWDRYDAISLKEPYSSNAIKYLGDRAVVFEDRELVHQTFNVISSSSFIFERPETVKGILRAFVSAEKYAEKYPKKAFELLTSTHEYDKTRYNSIMSDISLTVSLKQSLLITLEDSARWMIREELTDRKKIPNYLNFIYTDTLETVKPERALIIK